MLALPTFLVALTVAAAARAAAPIPSTGPPPSPTATTAPASGAAAGASASIGVTIAPARARLLLGVDSEVPVAIEVTGPDAPGFTIARVLTTVGTLEPPRATAVPGRFVTRYLAPAERFPEVALLVVELANGLRRVHAVARIALEGSTTVPFRTAPGVAVSMRVGDRVFGPVVGDRQGHVEIPIQVPPGVRSGVARAVERDTPARETEVDLQLPAFPRVLILAPDTVEAGAFAEVPVLAVNPDGTPTLARDVNLTASGGLIHPLGPGLPGEARFLFEAPQQLGTGAIALTAVAAGVPLARADVAVPMRPGRAAALTITPGTRRLVVGSEEVAEIRIAAYDAFGNPASAGGLRAEIDGVARPVTLAPGGAAGMVTVEAPRTFDGHEQIAIAARLGDVRATEQIRVTGGAPVRLTLDVRDRRLIADGHRSTELRVRAVDRNGTPTTVPGLSWQTPDGRVRNVRIPHEGEYMAEYVPDRTREAQRQQVSVMASSALRADATVEVTPPPVRLVVAARAGLAYNLGHSVGPSAFIEALTPLRLRLLRLYAGIAAGYLHGDVNLPHGIENSGYAHLESDQMPVVAVLRARWPLSPRFDLSVDGEAGLSWAATTITAAGAGLPQTATVQGNARGVALGGGGELGFRLKPGHLVLGVRYLWIELGRTSQGDQVSGNSAGLIGDIGYKMTF